MHAPKQPGLELDQRLGQVLDAAAEALPTAYCIDSSNRLADLLVRLDAEERIWSMAHCQTWYSSSHRFLNRSKPMAWCPTSWRKIERLSGVRRCGASIQLMARPSW